MPKNMALVENGVVTNILWCSDEEPQTESLIDMNDLPVGIDDTYDGTAFYRDGEKVLSAYEALAAEYASLSEDFETLLTGVEELANE